MHSLLLCQDMKTANYFNGKLTELLNNRGTWINANQASDFAKWCKIIGILVSGGAFNQDNEQYLYINE